MTTIALVDRGPSITEVRRRLQRSPLAFDLVDDPAQTDLVVTDQPAPVPNFLTVAAAATPDVFYCRPASVDYVVAALTEAHLVGAHGVRVRPSVQARPDRAPRPHWWRRAFRPLVHFDATHFDWSGVEDVEAGVFDDEAHVVLDDAEFTARLRARGRTDGAEGRFRWAGILYGAAARAAAPDGRGRVQVRIRDGAPVDARLTDLTPWGTVRIAGVGAPPWSPDTEPARLSR
ncbi:DUF4873 domain-containing protein [Gordonia alkaliphila]|uniref:DUF4873 domain-containing protein n=1 Tax=Gordonia alkaliphila TaxID=1053547 RepID=A0ABP8Z417_9ACTN